MPKLALRDLFAAVTIVALILGWWMDHRRQSRFAIRVKELEAQTADLRAALEDQRQQSNRNWKLYLDETARNLEPRNEAASPFSAAATGP